MNILIILTLTTSTASVLAEPELNKDESNSKFLEGFFLGNLLGIYNQIGGDGSKPGFCPSHINRPGESSQNRGKRSPGPNWWNSNSHHKPNYNNGGGLNWNNPGGSSYHPGGNNYNPGGSSYHPGGNHYNPGGSSHYPGNRPGGSSHHHGKRSAEYAPWDRPNYGYGIGGSSYYPGGNYYNPGGSSYYPGGHYGHHNKPNYNNGGLNWNYPGYGIGGSSYYPGGIFGGHHRGKRSPENAPWLSNNNSNKPNYNNGGLDWNNNYNGGLQWNNKEFGIEIFCYSDKECPGRQKCCNRTCTQPIYY